MILAESRIRAGQWQGLVAEAAAPPRIELIHDGQPLGEAVVTPAPQGGFRLVLDLPVALLTDGVQTLVLRDMVGDQIVGRIALQVGQALSASLAADVALLRAELDLLRQAFRRHCREGGGGAA